MTSTVSASAATHQSANFVVTASSEPVARQVAEIAEEQRMAFISEWLGPDVRDWEIVCEIIVEEQPTGSQGWISYELYRGEIDKLTILLTGRLDRILEYVLPHEIAHAALAVSLGRSIPRWADEGIALLSESESQRARQRMLSAQLASTDHIMPLSDMLNLVDYPDSHGQMIHFYASSFSLVEYLVLRGGKQRLLDFVSDGDRHGWDAAVRRHYGCAYVSDLEAEWRSWVLNDGQTAPVGIATALAPTDR